MFIGLLIYFAESIWLTTYLHFLYASKPIRIYRQTNRLSGHFFALIVVLTGSVAGKSLAPLRISLHLISRIAYSLVFRPLLLSEINCNAYSYGLCRWEIVSPPSIHLMEVSVFQTNFSLIPMDSKLSKLRVFHPYLFA